MINKRFSILLIVIIVLVAAFSINYLVKRGKQEIPVPTPAVTVSSDYYDDQLYCEKDSDCTVQETVYSKCCGNSCPQIVSIYHTKQTKIDCSNAGCTDRYFTCPSFEVKCIDNQCKRINLEE